MDNNPYIPLHIIDNKEVKWTVHQSAHGFSCNTCVHYGLPTPLEGDNPKLVHRDISDEDLALVIRVNDRPMGFCTVFEGTILINVPKLDSCNKYVEKPTAQQFDDDGVEQW